MQAKDSYISCPRFGGYRTAPACIALDRYRVCRRSCKSLEAYIKAHPEIVDQAKENLKGRNKEGLRKEATHAGERLPDSARICKRCGFIARTERGMKTHQTRSHGGKGQ